MCHSPNFGLTSRFAAFHLKSKTINLSFAAEIPTQWPFIRWSVFINAHPNTIVTPRSVKIGEQPSFQFPSGLYSSHISRHLLLSAILKKQTAVAAYLKSKLLLLFASARQSRLLYWDPFVLVSAFYDCSLNKGVNGDWLVIPSRAVKNMPVFAVPDE